MLFWECDINPYHNVHFHFINDELRTSYCGINLMRNAWYFQMIAHNFVLFAWPLGDVSSVDLKWFICVLFVKVSLRLRPKSLETMEEEIFCPRPGILYYSHDLTSRTWMLKFFNRYGTDFLCFVAGESVHVCYVQLPGEKVWAARTDAAGRLYGRLLGPAARYSHVLLWLLCFCGHLPFIYNY